MIKYNDPRPFTMWTFFHSTGYYPRLNGRILRAIRNLKRYGPPKTINCGQDLEIAMLTTRRVGLPGPWYIRDTRKSTMLWASHPMRCPDTRFRFPLGTPIHRAIDKILPRLRQEMEYSQMEETNRKYRNMLKQSAQQTWEEHVLSKRTTWNIDNYGGITIHVGPYLIEDIPGVKMRHHTGDHHNGYINYVVIDKGTELSKTTLVQLLDNIDQQTRRIRSHGKGFTIWTELTKMIDHLEFQGGFNRRIHLSPHLEDLVFRATLGPGITLKN